MPSVLNLPKSQCEQLRRNFALKLLGDWAVSAEMCHAERIGEESSHFLLRGDTHLDQKARRGFKMRLRGFVDARGHLWADCQNEAVFGAGYGHIHEAPFILDALFSQLQRLLAGHHSLIAPGDYDGGELKPLGGVAGHQEQPGIIRIISGEFVLHVCERNPVEVFRNAGDGVLVDVGPEPRQVRAAFPVFGVELV